MLVFSFVTVNDIFIRWDISLMSARERESKFQGKCGFQLFIYTGNVCLSMPCNNSMFKKHFKNVIPINLFMIKAGL